MVKRVLPSEVLVSPGLADVPVMDLMCSHLVLSLTAKQGSKFNVRRDLGSLFALTGRHLVWPAPVCASPLCYTLAPPMPRLTSPSP